MTIWSSRNRLGTRGKRCTIFVRGIGQKFKCGRPAKSYSESYDAFGQTFEVGCITVCKGHATMLEKQGLKLKEIKR
jgi:hypothetical protein